MNEYNLGQRGPYDMQMTGLGAQSDDFWRHRAVKFGIAGAAIGYLTSSGKSPAWHTLMLGSIGVGIGWLFDKDAL